jgi:hypothetical protein
VVWIVETVFAAVESTEMRAVVEYGVADTVELAVPVPTEFTAWT